MLTSRELRLAAVAVAGLGLIFMARTGDSQSATVATQSAGEPDVAAVADAGSAGEAVAGTGVATDPADQLAGMRERAIRLVDFREVDQSVDLCDEGISEQVRGSLETIELGDGTSDVIDEQFLSQLDVLDQAFGDISGNGTDEAVIHTVCGFGASGRQHEVQVWDTSGGVAEPVGTVAPPAPELTGPFPPDVAEIAVSDGVLEVTWTVYADDDPNCCPSDLMTLSYQLVEGEIVEVD